MRNATILVVDDEGLVRWSLTERLKSEGYRLLEASTARGALEQLEGVDLVLLNDQLPDMDGASVLRKMKERAEDALVILLSAPASVDVAVEAMKRGVHHVAHKPLNPDEIVAIVKEALETARLRQELREYRAKAARPYTLHSIVGNSPSVTELRHLVARVATSPASTVWLTGERGSGKNLVAKVLHYSSERASGRFVDITCAAVPDFLRESELFGHERGVLTGGGHLQRRGLLELADGGTVFLDDIGEMGPGLQAKLLRLLEEKAFTRVGGATDVHVDVRVVAASTRHLEDAVAKGSFSDDLFHRLNILSIELPALRTHPEDIPLLVEYFIGGFNTEFGKKVVGASPAAYAVLQRYQWPGNVRELRNVVERAMLLAGGHRLDACDFASVGASRGEPIDLPAQGINMEEVERTLVLQALRRCGWNQTRASALLGLNRDQIRYRIGKYGLSLTA